MDHRREGSGMSVPCVPREALADSSALREVCPSPSPGGSAVPLRWETCWCHAGNQPAPWRGPARLGESFLGCREGLAEGQTRAL